MGKGGWHLGLTTQLPACADCLDVWEPHSPETLGACPGLYRDRWKMSLKVSFSIP